MSVAGAEVKPMSLHRVLFTVNFEVQFDGSVQVRELVYAASVTGTLSRQSLGCVPENGHG
jgi:hypothetical protein